MINKFPYTTGGADSHFLALTKALRKAGHEIQVLSTASDQNVAGPGAFVPIAVTNASRDHLAPADQLRVVRRSIWNQTAKAALDWLLAEFSPDVVHLHKLYPQLSVSAVVTAARSAPIVQTVHDREFISARPEELPQSAGVDTTVRARYRLLEHAMFVEKRLAHIPRIHSWILPSRALDRDYRARGIAGTVIPHFVEAGDHTHRAFSDREGVMFAGRLTEAKGVMDFVAMAARSDGVPFTIAGSGDLSNWVCQKAADIRCLTYAGRITPESVRERMRQSRVVVVPSHLPEAAGLTALEAMASGTPTVAYPSGGLPEYVLDQRTGRLARDQADLERLTHALHRDRVQWTRISRRCIQTANGRHSASRYIERLTAVYEDASATWQ